MSAMRNLLVLFLLMAGVSSAAAQDWTQWRGPSRDGIVPAAVIPRQWPQATKRAWQLDIGEGIHRPLSPTGARSCTAAAIRKRS